MREQGTVKFFNDEKGYGFIRCDSDRRELYVHHSDIQMPGYRTLEAGARVEFHIEDHGRGPRAAEVITVE